MKKSFNFILVLLVVFSLLFTKLNDDSHVISIKSIIGAEDTSEESESQDVKCCRGTDSSYEESRAYVHL